MRAFVAVLYIHGQYSVSGFSFSEEKIIAHCEKVARRTNLTVRLEGQPRDWYSVKNDYDPTGQLWYEEVESIDTVLDALVTE